MNEASPETALRRVASDLARLKRPFALVGGMAVSIRGEVRFTRDVDVAVVVGTDAETESLVRDLAASGYGAIATVEHETRRRLATVRLRSPSGVTVDLMAASSGIEAEVVSRAQPVEIDGVGTIPVARAEELLALKVLSMTSRRPQDAIDARGLVATNPALDVGEVRRLLEVISSRGFDRGQKLDAKLDEVLATALGP
jgi:predicted nucleotidyltransferase